ncbi:MAG TPA: response regulator transcription factor [Mycobacteriales bacterium]|nr:response regulator transcription factor [Mycobacteriales bacterium]
MSRPASGAAAARLLLVEDDRGIAEPLTRGLRDQGYLVTWAGTAEQARGAVRDGAPDLVLLDLGLPDLDGTALCRELREQLPLAVIVILTARDAEVDVVVGLEAGADDYLVKPFRFSELLARLRAHLRRQDSLTSTSTPDTRHDEPDALPDALSVGEVRIDVAARRCRIAGRDVELRPKEFDLLVELLAAAGRAVTREQLMARVWDENYFGSTKTLDMHIGMLRRRLADNGADPDRITTLRGYGYRFEADAGPGDADAG